MTARLPSAMLVSALVRRVQAEGGHATILARGEADAGAILFAAAERGRISGLFERVLDIDGVYQWAPCGPQTSEKEAEFSDYLDRRIARDPDLWVIELDIADAERFAAETIASG